MNPETFFKITYGLYIVSAKLDNKLNGFISNTVFQVTAEPAQLAIVCSKNNYTADMIKQSKAVSISALQKEVSQDIIAAFGYRSGKDFEKFSNYLYKTGKTGAPILLKDTIAWFECEIVQTLDVGTHIIFIGKVVDGEILNDTLEPLTYSYYRDVRKGKAPRNSPTYVDPEKIIKKDELVNLDLYKCSVCGYIYNPKDGDLLGDIAEGTNFSDLPHNWQCPICGVDKSFFNKIEV
jgi:flavin reductase (DIM6/NTAB) family NADH-FMN oxidoreductase RutF/rubredoxin